MVFVLLYSFYVSVTSFLLHPFKSLNDLNLNLVLTVEIFYL